MNAKLFEEVLKECYPNLTAAHRAAILEIAEGVINIPALTSHADRKSSKAHPSGWAVLNPLSSPAAKCQKRLVAFASDRNRLIPQWPGSFTLRDALAGVMDYYGRCHGITELGVLITNVWRPGELSAFKRDIESFEQCSIQSVAILVSNHTVLPINWPWR